MGHILVGQSDMVKVIILVLWKDGWKQLFLSESESDGGE